VRRFRAGFLLLLGLTGAAYGCGILAEARGVRPDWLPQPGHRISELAPGTWAWLWIGAGAALAAGCWCRPLERWLFGLAAVVNGGWSAAFVTGWIRYGVHGAWGPAVAFGGITAAVLLCSAWPDPPPRPRPPDEDLSALP
jgi:hypothetical protein